MGYLGKAMLDKNAILADIKVGKTVRIRRTWCSPHAGAVDVVSAMEPNDAYGAYIIELRTGCIFDITVRSWNQLGLEPLTFIDMRFASCMALFAC